MPASGRDVHQRSMYRISPAFKYLRRPKSLEQTICTVRGADAEEDAFAMSATGEAQWRFERLSKVDRASIFRLSSI